VIEAPDVASDDDTPKSARFVSVRGDGLVGVEVQIALDEEAEFAADSGKHDRALRAAGAGTEGNDLPILPNDFLTRHGSMKWAILRGRLVPRTTRRIWR
jgi:hypothetical protein